MPLATPSAGDLSASLLVAAVAVLATGGAIFDSFTYWDDDVYVLRNALVLAPSFEALGRILTEPFYANYQPLHLLSYWIDGALWNLHPAGMHAFNVVLYALGCFLLHRLARRLPLPAPVVLVGLLLYAAHPTHVEPVAWISARKDCLMLPLLAGACLLWLRDGARARAGALALGTAAALAKSQAMVLPGLLLALDLMMPRPQPREPAELGPGGTTAAAPRFRVRDRLVPVIPFAVVSVLVAMAAVAAQAAAGALKVVPGSLLAHAGTVVRSVVFSLRLALWPHPLSAIYDLAPATGLGAAELAGLGALAALVAAAVHAWRRGSRLPAFALLWAAASLAPVSGLVPLAVLAADRYLLLPTFGLMLAAAAALHALRLPPRVFAAVAAALILAATTASALRTRVWRDDLSLWRDTAARAPASGLAAANLGAALADAGRFAEAAAALARAESLRPGDPTVFANRVRLAVRLEAPALASSPDGAALDAALRAALAADPVTLCAVAVQYEWRGARGAGAIVTERALRLGAPADCYRSTKVAVPGPPARP